LRQLVARLALAAVEGLASSTLFVEHMTHESFDFVGGLHTRWTCGTWPIIMP
jgi:hypothetical protein